MKNILMIGFTLFSINALAQVDPGPATSVEQMHSYSLNGFTLTGAEYWVHVQGQNFQYPNDVLWGFQGEYTNAGGTSLAPLAARDCALIAYNKLNSFLKNPPSRFVQLKDKGATPRFFLWTNDYSKADPNQAERPNKFWHWNSGNKDYTKGYWKWESTLTHDSKCVIPEDTQIAEMVEFVHEAMGQ